MSQTNGPILRLGTLVSIPGLVIALAVARAEAVAPATTVAPETAQAVSEIFVDRAEPSGLRFVHVNGASGRFYLPEITGPGGALFDYDNDGDLDLYLIQGGSQAGVEAPDEGSRGRPAVDQLTDRLYRNDLSLGPSGKPLLRFEDVTRRSGIRVSSYGMGATAGDIDNDGWVDLYVTDIGRNRMLRNGGDGTFSDVTAATGTGDALWSVSAAFLDYNRDGHLDLYVGNYVEFDPANVSTCRSMTGVDDYCGPAAYRPQPDRLLRNRGNGTFEDVSGPAGLLDSPGAALGVVAADFDGDGWIDLYVANDLMPNNLWRNQGDGTFQDEAPAAGCAIGAAGYPEGSMGVDAADFDDDGDEDIFVANYVRETNSLFVNQEANLFDDRTERLGLAGPSWDFTAFGAAWLDYDNDGRLDLMTANGAVQEIEDLALDGDPFPRHERNQLFRNLGEGRFLEVSDRAGRSFEQSEVSRGAAFGDIDNDGDVDAVVFNNNGPVRLLINRAGQENRWLAVNPIGPGGRPMLGARLEIVRPPAPTLWRRSRSDGSFASANDPRILAGLGETRAIEALRLHWPDGSVTRLERPQPNRFLSLRQEQQAPGRDNAPGQNRLTSPPYSRGRVGSSRFNSASGSSHFGSSGVPQK